MNIRQLMIGDWVINPAHKDVSKIEGIYYDKELHCLVGTDGRFPQNHYEPIPLTEEMLKANGFVYNKGCWWFGKSLFMLNEFIDGGYCASAFHEQVFINYVHELQHALRICGLNELADNFKIG